MRIQKVSLKFQRVAPYITTLWPALYRTIFGGYRCGSSTTTDTVSDNYLPLVSAASIANFSSNSRVENMCDCSCSKKLRFCFRLHMGELDMLKFSILTNVFITGQASWSVAVILYWIFRQRYHWIS